jgi:hypothetical protein
MEPDLHYSRKQMSPGVSGFPKMLHLADARTAFASGDLRQALSDVDAALAIDPAFAAAQALRADVIAGLAAPPVVRSTVEAHPKVQCAKRVRPRALAATVSVAVLASVLGLGLMRRTRVDSAPVAAATATAVVRVAHTSGPVPAAAVVVPPDPAPPKEPTGVVRWVSRRLNALDVRPGWRASVLHVDDTGLLKDLGEGIRELWVGRLSDRLDAIFIGRAVEPGEWTTLHASLNARGVVWRIYKDHATAAAGAVSAAAAAAGFRYVKRVRYSDGYSAEQFMLRRARSSSD